MLSPRSSIGEVISGHEFRSLQAQCVLRLFILGMVCVNISETTVTGVRWIVSLTVTCLYGAWLILLVARVVANRALPGQVPCIVIDTAALTSILIAIGGFQEFTISTSGFGYLDYAYLLLPILAAFQIDPRATLFVSIAETGAWLCGAGFTTIDPDWTTIGRFVVFSAVVGLACVFISAINRSRVSAIAELAEARAQLLEENVVIEERERQVLSEAIHDGPLQTLLATRQDVSEIREQLDAVPDGPDTAERVDRNLQVAVSDLRTAIRGLHPAVAQEVGLVESLRNLADTSAARGGFALEFHDGLPAAVQIPAHVQKLVISAAREFLENAVRHSRARTLRVALALTADMLHLEVSDDGVGASASQLRTSLQQGHIGIASQRTRIESAGGGITMQGSEGHGVTVVVTVPLR
ncbi:sensor histidine kinase [Streptomyces sp. NPDC085932]|uniref:sensor histidine kinase n=1 Tax=Streptomyces sp. NPDC085932 TaxID=3365741 RepID=UPI0037D54A15